MITLIMAYEIAVSVDIETDQQICDAQRGEGYYARTRSAMNRLVDEGIPVEEVCTLTPCFADAAGRIFGSFVGLACRRQAVPYPRHCTYGQSSGTCPGAEHIRNDGGADRYADEVRKRYRPEARR